MGEDFYIDLNFGGGKFKAKVIGNWLEQQDKAIYSIYVNHRKIVQLEMCLEKLEWISTYGKLDSETIQYIGSKIDNHYNL